MLEIKKIIESVQDTSVNEAKFSKKRLKRVSDLLASILGKTIGGGKAIQLKGELGFETFHKPGIGEGEGYKYLFKNGKIIRFGYLKSSKSQYLINQVDLWKIGDKFNEPSISITVADWLNIVEVVGELKDILSEKSILKEELKKLPPKKLIMYYEFKGFKYNNESPYAIKKVLQQNGLWDDEEYKGFKVKKKTETNTKETNSTEKVFKKAEKVLEKKKYADPDVIFDDIEDLTKVVASGAQNSMIIAGMAGVGKTFHVEKALKEVLGSPKGQDAKWRHRKGAKLTPLGLYSDLFANRHDMVIVYDDSDSVWGDADAVNILKSALDTYPVRELSWTSSSTMNVELLSEEDRIKYFAQLDKLLREDPAQVGKKVKLPASFEFSSRIIFISNLPAEKIDSAIRSRSIFVDVHLRQEDVIRRIKSILPFIEPEVPLDEKLRIVERLAESESQLTMRAVTAAIAIKNVAEKIGMKSDWERLVRSYV